MTTVVTDYIAKGPLSERPATPPIDAGALAIWLDTDTDLLTVWDGAAWVLAANYAAIIDVDFSAYPTTNPEDGTPWLDGNATDGWIVKIGPKAGAGVVPNSPTELTASNITISSVDLSWINSTAGTPTPVYQAQERVNGSTTWNDSGGTVSAPPVTVGGLAAGTKYDFQVVASNVVGEAASSAIMATTAVAATAPTAPTDFRVSVIHSQSVELAWTNTGIGTAPVNNQTKFRLVGAGSWTDGPLTTGSSATITGLASLTDYEFELTASNDTGSATTSPPVPAQTLGTTWSITDKAPSLSLSGGDLTVTHTAATAAMVRSYNPKSADKLYLSFVNTKSGVNQRIGIANAAASLSSPLGSDTNSFGIDANGVGWINNKAVTGSGGDPWTNGGTIELGVNLDADKAWNRINSGTWGDPSPPSEVGSQDSGAGNPVVSGAATIDISIAQTITLASLAVKDSSWPAVGNVSLNVSCNVGGTVDITPLGGTLTPGSGPESFSYSDTDANIQAAIDTVTYTAPGTPASDAVVVQVFNQLGIDNAITIASTVSPNPDPSTGVGGFDLSGLAAGPYSFAYSSSQSGDAITANAGASPPPNPLPFEFLTWDDIPPPLPGDMTGTQALRSADVLGIYGANFFPNGQDGSRDAGTNTAAAFEQAIRYWTADTGADTTNRIYDDGPGSDQSPIPIAVSLVLPATKWCLAWAQKSTIASMVASGDNLRAAGCLAFIEGPNEPNNSLGAGGTGLTAAQCFAACKGMWDHFHPLGVKVATASVIDTASDTYVQDYWGTRLAAAIARSDYYNGHDYPNSGSPTNDLWRRTGMFVDAGWPVGGVLPEFHSLLYNGSIVNETLGALWELATLFSGVKYYGLKSFEHYSIYDYKNFGKPVGLFHGFDPTNPRPVAKAIHNLFSICGDAATRRHTFPATKLAYTLTGMPAAFAGPTGPASGGGQDLLLQLDDGTFRLCLWNDQNALNLGHTDTVTVTFPVPHDVIDTSLTNPMTDSPTPIQTLSGVLSVTVNLTTEFRVLAITY